MNIESRKRCIMIFPSFKNMNIIDSIRDKYDPLAKHVRPHITLVFPFESSINRKELENYLKTSLEKVKCFDLTLDKIIKIDDNSGVYLFLNIGEGKQTIKEIHNKLYKGILNEYKPNWLKEVEFFPHMTVGDFVKKEELEKAYEDSKSIEIHFSTLVEKISVEIIDDNEDSIIEIEVNLDKKD